MNKPYVLLEQYDALMADSKEWRTEAMESRAEIKRLRDRLSRARVLLAQMAEFPRHAEARLESLVFLHELSEEDAAADEVQES